MKGIRTEFSITETEYSSKRLYSATLSKDDTIGDGFLEQNASLDTPRSTYCCNFSQMLRAAVLQTAYQQQLKKNARSK